MKIAYQPFMDGKTLEQRQHDYKHEMSSSNTSNPTVDFDTILATARGDFCANVDLLVKSFHGIKIVESPYLQPYEYVLCIGSGLSQAIKRSKEEKDT